MPSENPAPWCSGLTRLPVKEEIGSSNLLGVATLFLKTRLAIFSGWKFCTNNARTSTGSLNGAKAFSLRIKYLSCASLMKKRRYLCASQCIALTQSSPTGTNGIRPVLNIRWARLS